MWAVLAIFAEVITTQEISTELDQKDKVGSELALVDISIASGNKDSNSINIEIFCCYGSFKYMETKIF